MGLSDMGFVDTYLAYASNEAEVDTPAYLLTQIEEMYEQLVEVCADNAGLTILANNQCSDAAWLIEYHRFGADFGAAVGRLGRVIEQAKRK
jgi:hypothetical protein